MAFTALKLWLQWTSAQRWEDEAAALDARCKSVDGWDETTYGPTCRWSLPRQRRRRRAMARGGVPMSSETNLFTKTTATRVPVTQKTAMN